MSKLKFYNRDFCPACNCKNSKYIFTVCTFKNGGNYFLLKKN